MSYYSVSMMLTISPCLRRDVMGELGGSLPSTRGQGHGLGGNRTWVAFIKENLEKYFLVQGSCWNERNSMTKQASFSQFWNWP